jgi:hypothetical protein
VLLLKRREVGVHYSRGDDEQSKDGDALYEIKNAKRYDVRFKFETHQADDENIHATVLQAPNESHKICPEVAKVVDLIYVEKYCN